MIMIKVGGEKMIQCPWCSNQVNLYNNTCPECRHEVLPEHLASDATNGDSTVEGYQAEPSYDLDIEDVISNKYKCTKCKHDECHIKEVAMNGAGLSKVFDIEYNHFLFVSCTNCGYVEVYNPDVLRGKKSGVLGSVMDVLFG